MSAYKEMIRSAPCEKLVYYMFNEALDAAQVSVWTAQLNVTEDEPPHTCWQFWYAASDKIAAEALKNERWLYKEIMRFITQVDVLEMDELNISVVIKYIRHRIVLLDGWRLRLVRAGHVGVRPRSFCRNLAYSLNWRSRRRALRLDVGSHGHLFRVGPDDSRNSGKEACHLGGQPIVRGLQQKDFNLGNGAVRARLRDFAHGVSQLLRDSLVHGSRRV